MGRPKGSKNKSTLEREARERELESEERKNNNGELKNLPQESIPESDPSVYMGEEENGSERTTEGIMETKGTGDTKEEPKRAQGKKKSQGQCCERCGEEISGDPLKLDTNLLTGKADYHRESRRYVRLCNKCSNELSDLVDRWLWDKRKGGNPELRKFPLSGE